MLKLSDRVRDDLRAQLAPCPTCQHPRTTIVALSSSLGVGASALGRYLGGATPSVPLLDAAVAFIEATAKADTLDVAANIRAQQSFITERDPAPDLYAPEG